MSQNDNHHDNDNIEDFLDFSIYEDLIDKSDEKPKTELNSSSANVVTILFKKNEEPKIKNKKKSTEKGKANEHARMYECLICGRDRLVKSGEEDHDKESLFYYDLFSN